MWPTGARASELATLSMVLGWVRFSPVPAPHDVPAPRRPRGDLATRPHDPAAGTGARPRGYPRRAGAGTHARSLTRARADAHAHTHTYAYARTHASRAHTRARTHTRTCVRVRAHADMHMRAHVPRNLWGCVKEGRGRRSTTTMPRADLTVSRPAIRRVGCALLLALAANDK